MFKIANIVTDVKDIPEEWIYKQYLKLAGKNIDTKIFDGRIITLRSPWNNDTNASFFIFYKNKKYFWKDFSTGIGGDVYSLVQRIRSISSSKVFSEIIKTYSKFIEEGGVIDSGLVPVEQISTFEPTIDVWDQVNSMLWDQWKITKKTRDFFNIVPLRNYKRFVNGNLKNEFWKKPMYGFFSNDGLSKIYMPGNEPKYINCNKNYIAGFEQLTHTKKILLIQSGLKDIAAMHELELSVESIAPPSETVILKSDLIVYLKRHYDFIFTLFDNDRAGKMMAMVYKETYGIEPIFTNLNKDTSDDLKLNEKTKLRMIYAHLINNKTNE